MELSDAGGRIRASLLEACCIIQMPRPSEPDSHPTSSSPIARHKHVMLVGSNVGPSSLWQASAERAVTHCDVDLDWAAASRAMLSMQRTSRNP